MTALTVILGILSTIFIFVVVILARGKARAMTELQLARERENVTYEEITLSPLDTVSTSKNIAYSHL